MAARALHGGPLGVAALEGAAAMLLEQIAAALTTAAGESWAGATDAQRAAMRADAGTLVEAFGRHGLFIVTAGDLAAIGETIRHAQTVQTNGPVSLLRTGRGPSPAAAGAPAAGALDTGDSAHALPHKGGEDS